MCPLNLSNDLKPKWGFPKTRGTLLGVPIIRTIVYWGPLILGNYQIIPNPMVLPLWTLLASSEAAPACSIRVVKASG